MQLDLFDRLKDDEDLKAELESIDPNRKYHPIELTELLRCSLRMVYRLNGSGELLGFRVGTSIRIFG